MDSYWTLGSWPGFDPPEGVTASVASLRLAGPAYATTPPIWYHRKGIMADLTSDPKGYGDLLALLTARIRAAQLRASITVNQELLLLYWGIGKEILTRQRDDGWGTKVIERLANDLRQEFPEMRGLSPRNLGYMRAFADAWPDEAILQAPLAKLTWYQNITLIQKVNQTASRADAACGNTIPCITVGTLDKRRNH